MHILLELYYFMIYEFTLKEVHKMDEEIIEITEEIIEECLEDSIEKKVVPPDEV